MSSEIRVCKSCGAKLDPGDRKCPSCGRLNIDSSAARLGSRTDSVPPPPEESVDTTTPTTEEASAGEAAPETAEPEPGGGAKPDSFYAVAPAPIPHEEEESKGTTCCNPCAIIFIVIFSILSWVFVL